MTLFTISSDPDRSMNLEDNSLQIRLIFRPSTVTHQKQISHTFQRGFGPSSSPDRAVGCITTPRCSTKKLTLTSESHQEHLQQRICRRAALKVTSKSHFKNVACMYRRCADDDRNASLLHFGCYQQCGLMVPFFTHTNTSRQYIFFKI